MSDEVRSKFIQNGPAFLTVPGVPVMHFECGKG
jgi:hypothetical protein